MKYEVIINKKGRRMYYGTPEGKKKTLMSDEDIPTDILEVLTPVNSVDTNREDISEKSADPIEVPEALEAVPITLQQTDGDIAKMRKESEGALTEDTSVTTKQPDEVASVPVVDDSLLVDKDEYIKKDKDPAIKTNKIEAPKPILVQGCLFGDGEGTKVKRVNRVNVRLCDEHYVETTPGKIVEQMNKIQSKAPISTAYVV